MSRYKVPALRQLRTPFIGATPFGATGEVRYRRRSAPAAVPSSLEEDTRLRFHRQSKAIKHAALLFYLPALVMLGLIIAD